jgi:hypothetical protein
VWSRRGSGRGRARPDRSPGSIPPMRPWRPRQRRCPPRRRPEGSQLTARGVDSGARAQELGRRREQVGRRRGTRPAGRPGPRRPPGREAALCPRRSRPESREQDDVVHAAVCARGCAGAAPRAAPPPG